MKCLKSIQTIYFRKGFDETSIWKKIWTNRSINNKVITKKNFDEQKKINFVLIYNFFTLRSKMVVISINVFAFIMFMRKIKRKQKTQY